MGTKQACRFWYDAGWQHTCIAFLDTLWVSSWDACSCNLNYNPMMQFDFWTIKAFPELSAGTADVVESAPEKKARVEGREDDEAQNGTFEGTEPVQTGVTGADDALGISLYLLKHLSTRSDRRKGEDYRHLISSSTALHFHSWNLHSPWHRNLQKNC